MSVGRTLHGLLVHRGQVLHCVFLQLAVVLEVHVERGLYVLHVASQALTDALARLNHYVRKVHTIPVLGP